MFLDENGGGTPPAPEPTPAPDPVEPPTPDPQPVRTPEPPKDSRSVESRLEGMETAISNLMDTLSGLLPKADPTPEAQPVKKPWTHWGTKDKK